MEPAGAEKYVEVLKPPRRFTTWIPGTRLHKAGHDADSVDQTPYLSADARKRG